MTPDAMQAPRVLIVDDDRLVLATLATGLRQAGFDVMEADDGDESIILARNRHPELAILDLRMRGKNGLDVARYLTAHTTTRFVFLSAFSDEDTVTQAVAAGALGYLVKPLDIRQIVPTIRIALARARELRGLDQGHGSAFDATSAALGVLMERHRSDVSGAAEWLARFATSRRLTRAEAARLVIASAEVLNGVRAPPATEG